MKRYGRRTTVQRTPACKIIHADYDDGDLTFDDEAVFMVFALSGITVARHEEVFSQCVDRKGSVAGVSVLGMAGGGIMRFSVAVHPKARRKGIARMLVLDIMEHYVSERDELSEAYGLPGVTLEAWVINPYMAALLEDLGFDGDWSPSNPMMQWDGDAKDIPGSAAWKRAKAKEAKRKAAVAKQYAADAPMREAKAARERAEFEAEQAAVIDQWRKAGVKAREAKAQALMATPSPIPGYSVWDSIFGRTWRKKLNVDKAGKALPYGQAAKQRKHFR